jgi:hypothetical protein
MVKISLNNKKAVKSPASCIPSFEIGPLCKLQGRITNRIVVSFVYIRDVEIPRPNWLRNWWLVERRKSSVGGYPFSNCNNSGARRFRD